MDMWKDFLKIYGNVTMFTEQRKERGISRTSWTEGVRDAMKSDDWKSTGRDIWLDIRMQEMIAAVKNNKTIFYLLYFPRIARFSDLNPTPLKSSFCHFMPTVLLPPLLFQLLMSGVSSYSCPLWARSVSFCPWMCFCLRLSVIWCCCPGNMMTHKCLRPSSTFCLRQLSRFSSWMAFQNIL